MRGVRRHASTPWGAHGVAVGSVSSSNSVRLLFGITLRAQSSDNRNLSAHADESGAARMREQNIPGVSLAVMRDGKIIQATGYRSENVELKVFVTPEMVFNSESPVKAFTATSVMMLVEKGKIGQGQYRGSSCNLCITSAWMCTSRRSAIAGGGRGKIYGGGWIHGTSFDLDRSNSDAGASFFAVAGSIGSIQGHRGVGKPCHNVEE